MKTDILSTDVISPLSSDSSGIAVELGPTQTFGIYNKEGSPAATFDSAGNVRLQGDLTARQATFSGTLYADRIVTRFGDLDERLAGLIEATRSSVIPDLVPASAGTDPALDSRLRGNDTIVDATAPSNVPVAFDATSSALLAQLENQELRIKNLEENQIISEGITLNSPFSILNSLFIDGTILIDKTGISTITDTLYIQPAKLG
ncbi:MAG: hypothetical protein AABZ61_02625, partial [Bacteroidota bacterium]